MAGIKKYMDGLIDKAKEVSPYHKIGRALKDAMPKGKEAPKKLTPAKKRKKIKPKK